MSTYLSISRKIEVGLRLAAADGAPAPTSDSRRATAGRALGSGPTRTGGTPGGPSTRADARPHPKAPASQTSEPRTPYSQLTRHPKTQDPPRPGEGVGHGDAGRPSRPCTEAPESRQAPSTLTGQRGIPLKGHPNTSQRAEARELKSTEPKPYCQGFGKYHFGRPFLLNSARRGTQPA